MNSFEQNILNLNKQLTLKALRFSNLKKLKGSNPDSIFVMGMGGSGTIGTILQNSAEDVNIKIPIIPWKDYGLPSTSFKKPLLLFVSFSGNTEETLSGFRQAKNYKFKAVVSGGGKLAKMAQETKNPLAFFEKKDLAPRQANGLMFYGALGIIKAVLPQTTIKDLSRLIKPEKFRLNSQKIAKKIKNKTVLIYTTTQNNHLGYLWKIHLNETAKALAFNNVVPEMNHNEIVGFEPKPKNVIALFLISKNDGLLHQKRLKISEQLLKKMGIPSLRINLKNGDAAARTFEAISLAEWTSYFLAKIKKINPLRTKSIEKIKSLI